MSKVFIKGKFYAEMHAYDYYKNFVIQTGFPIVLDALETLRKDFDVLILEGAGSPAEINIARYDIANMLLAQKISAPVILVSDIERGGCFASITGTIQLLKNKHQKLIKGFLINKFRGESSLLDDAINYIEKTRHIKCLGVIPKIDISLPEEDSLDGSSSNSNDRTKKDMKYSNEILDQQIDFLSTEIKKNVKVDLILDRFLKLNR
jgi:adenosylcobyric acid synthase